MCLNDTFPFLKPQSQSLGYMCLSGTDSKVGRYVSAHVLLAALRHLTYLFLGYRFYCEPQAVYSLNVSHKTR